MEVENGAEDEIEMTDLQEEEVPLTSTNEEVILTREEKEVLESSMWDDLQNAIFAARYIAPLLGVLGFFLAYYVTIHQHRHARPFTESEPLDVLRPVLTQSELLRIQTRTMYAETQFWLPAPSEDSIKVRFHRQVSKHGNFKLPQFFYEGVTFALTDGNYHDLKYSSRRDLAATDLQADLESMFPKPTHIMKKFSTYNVTGWSEEGYAVYFSYKDLMDQGKLSGDSTQPWKRVLEDILQIARNYRQVYVTVWYPNTFGDVSLLDPTDVHRFTNIIQQIVPTRTGLNELKSTTVVWLSAVNNNIPTKENHVYRQEWQESEPWMRKLMQESMEDEARLKDFASARYGGL